MERLGFLKKINELLIKIESKTKDLTKSKEEQVKLYDKWTKKVNDSIKAYKEKGKEANTKGWDSLLVELYDLYKEFLNKDK